MILQVDIITKKSSPQTIMSTCQLNLSENDVDLSDKL